MFVRLAVGLGIILATACGDDADKEGGKEKTQQHISAETGTPDVPEGYELVQLVPDPTFESSSESAGFDSSYATASVEAETNPLVDSKSLHIALQGYGGVNFCHRYGWGEGPRAKSVTVSAKLRVNSGTDPWNETASTEVCAIVYMPDYKDNCQLFPVNPDGVVDINLTIDNPDNEQLGFACLLVDSISSDTENTLDNAYLYVVQPVAAACPVDEWTCTGFGTCDNDGTQTRTCTNPCSTTTLPKPAESQSCTPAPNDCTTDVWTCTEFGPCVDGTQTRSCTVVDCPNDNSTPVPPSSQTCTIEPPPTPGSGHRRPSANTVGRYVAMMSPTNGEKFSSTTSIRPVAQAFDLNVFTNSSDVDGSDSFGHGQNAHSVEWYVDDTLIGTQPGNAAEYSVFKTFVSGVSLTPGTHQVWARAFYLNPEMVLDSDPFTITAEDPPTYAQEDIVDMVGDVVLQDQSYVLEGTPTARKRLNGHGHTITGAGSLTLRYVDVYDLGSGTTTTPSSTGFDTVSLTGSPSIDITGSVTIEGCNFGFTAPVKVRLAGSATAYVHGNTWPSNTKNPAGQLPFEPDSYHVVDFSGSSTGTKVFSGNRVAAGAVGFSNTNNWMIGGMSDADSNLLVGVRTSFEFDECTNCTVQGNLAHHVYYGGWSQGGLLEARDSTLIVKHNILIGSSWPIRGGGDSEFAYNYIGNGGHQSFSPGSRAYIHNNVFAGCGFASNGGECNQGLIAGIDESTGIRIENNTIDAIAGSRLPDMLVAAIWMQKASATVRSNAFVNVPNNGTGASVVSVAQVDENVTGSADADYNAFSAPGQRTNYSDGRTPAHDVVGHPNFNFVGPLPTEPVPADLSGTDVWNRQRTVSRLLCDYRIRYTPRSGSPLIDSGDPAGGEGNDIGAIGAGVSNALDKFAAFGPGCQSTALPPTTPNNVLATALASDRVLVRWSGSDSPTVPGLAQARVIAYMVFRNGMLIGNLTADNVRFEDTGLTGATSYMYNVAAIDSDGRTSDVSPTVTALTPPQLVVDPSAHPQLISPVLVAHLAAGGPDWDAQKQLCDENLNLLVKDDFRDVTGNQPDFAGWGWNLAAENYARCYLVAVQQGDTSNALEYGKKLAGIGKVLAFDHNFGTEDDTLQPIGLGDGVQQNFALPFLPMDPSRVKVTLVTTSDVAVFRTLGHDALGVFAPIAKVSNTLGGPADYLASSYALDFRDFDGADADGNGEMDTFDIRWLGSSQPTPGSIYYVTVASGNSVTLAASDYSVSGGTLTLNVPAASNQEVMVSFLGTNREQTGNGLNYEGPNSIEPDGPGYQMRTINPALAIVLRTLRDSGLLTDEMKNRFANVLREQIRWCSDFCFERSGKDGSISNYFTDGIVLGTLFTAYAVDDDDLKALANQHIMEVFEGLARIVPDGDAPEGQYAVGMTHAVLRTLAISNDIVGTDLTVYLDWTNNVVLSAIYGSDPQNSTGYDQGDWSEMPASPLDGEVEFFLDFLPDHSTAPYGRWFLQEMGRTPPPGTVSNYRETLPLSFLGKATGPVFARSDWSPNATWMAFKVNFNGAVAHQHLDDGHFSLKHGKDNLIVNGGGYNFMDPIPWHNTFGFDDTGISGYNRLCVYPQGGCQGGWGGNEQIIKRADMGSYVYSKGDWTDASRNNSGVFTDNSVLAAQRSVIFLRQSGLIAVFDRFKTKHAQIRVTENWNFGGTTLLTNGNSLWSTTVGASRLDMQAVIAPATAPVVTSLEGAGITSINFQEVTSGSTTGNFLHVFQASDASAPTMTPGRLVHSTDASVQGVELTSSTGQWTILFGATAGSFGGHLQFTEPSSGTHKNLVFDLVPSRAYVASVADANGTLTRSMAVTTDTNGSVAFDTAAGETNIYLTLGTEAPMSAPPVQN